MARYIDADEVLNAMDTWPKYGIKPDGRFIMLNKEMENDYVSYVHYEDMLKVVNGTPTADVKPVVHANWVGVSPQVDTIVCSNCGWNELASELATRYCPDCGATMDNYKEMSEVGLPSIENLKGTDNG